MASGIKKSKAPKKEKEVTLEQVLWNCRVALRGFGSFERIGIPLSAWHFLNLPGISLKNVEKK